MRLLLLTSLLYTTQAQVQCFNNLNGYFQQETGIQSEIIQKHRFVLSLSLTRIKSLINKLNIEINHPILQKQYNNYLEDIKNQFSIISHDRTKRGLINGLGTIIKFITGNPDNDDLNLINESIKNNKQLDTKTITTAKNIENQLHHTVREFNRNINEIKDTLYNITNTENAIINYQILNNQLEQILNFIKKIVMTITLSKANIINIELFDISQISSLKDILLNKYNIKQIIYSDKHPYKLLEYSELITYVQHSELKMILKIPILDKFEYKLNEIFPIPNKNATLLLAPTRFYSNEKWYTHCWHLEDKKYVCENHKPDQCNLVQPEKCTYASTDVNHYSYTSLKQTIISTKDPQTESCPSRKICEIYFMPVDCIQTQEFVIPDLKPTVIEARYKLKLRNISIPEGHSLEALQEDVPLHHYISWSSLLLACLITLIICSLSIYKRKRIQTLFLKPRPTKESLTSVLRGEKLRNMSPVPT